VIHPNSTISFHEHKETGRSDSYRQKVYDSIKLSSRPVTDREVWLALDRPDINNVRPEITRLKEDGLIEECQKTTCVYTHKSVRTLKVTDKSYFSRSNKRIA
jgi:predicted MarR family transcription regulator